MSVGRIADHQPGLPWGLSPPSPLASLQGVPVCAQRKPSAPLTPSSLPSPVGNGQQATPARFPPVPVQQEPGENAGAPGPQEASQDRSLDLTVKEPR